MFIDKFKNFIEVNNKITINKSLVIFDFAMNHCNIKMKI